jgi:tryptophan synthase alpha chain
MAETIQTVHNAVDRTFEQLRAVGRLAFIPYLTAGYPDVESALLLGQTLAAHGADLLEVGVPFSDPIGDGPTIQRSSSVALARGMTVRGALKLAAALVQSTDKPLVLMGYFNPILRYGLDRFCADAAAAGVAGLIVPDLPVEESDELQGCCHAHGMHLVYLLAPTSTEARIAGVAARATGFIYCMAVAGVTGARSDLASDLGAFLARVRARAALPLVVGFGISRPEHLERLRGVADGAVVASALIDLVDTTPPAERESAVAAYVERMSAACSAS